MAQYYIQNLDELQKIYGSADVQVVNVVSDDIGVNTHNQAQQLALQDESILLNNGRKVYQIATTTTAQPQYTQQHQQHNTTTHYIIGDDAAQQQPQQHQQVILHQQAMEQPQQQQHHYSQDPQQPQVQQMQQEHQMQHVQQQQQTQHQQIYYATDHMLQQQQQQQVVQQSPHVQQTDLQQQQQTLHVQHQQQQPQYSQQIVQTQQQQQQQQPQQQQHTLQQQSPQIHVQQQPSQHQIVYRMQTQQQQQSPQIHQQTQMLNNAHVIVQQSSSQVLLQSPQTQEIIMRQPMQPQRIIYNTNRVVYPQQTQTQAILQQSPPSHQQQQQQHIQLQTSPMHTQARLVQARVAGHTQQTSTQQSPQHQQLQQNVVFHPVQTVPGTQLQQKPLTQQIQMQAQQQQQPQLATTTITNMRGTTMRGGKIPRGGITINVPTLITRMPTNATMRGGVRATGTQAAGVLKTPRPRSSATAGGTPRVRGAGRGGRGGMNAGVGRGAHIATPVVGTIHMAEQQQQQQIQQIDNISNITTQNLNQPTQIKQIYRTQSIETNGTPQLQQQQHVQLIHTQTRHLQGVPRFRSSAVNAPLQTQQLQQTPNTSTSSGSGSNVELDLEDSIQAVVVKKDQQKTISIPANIGTTLTTYITKDDDDNRLVRTQNGTCITLAEYKKRSSLSTNTPIGINATIKGTTVSMRAGGGGPLAPNAANISKVALGSAAGQTMPSIPIARVPPLNTITQQQQQQQQQQNIQQLDTTTTQQQTTTASSVHQTSHNNYEIQTSHVLQNRSGQQMAEKDRNSAKMLVILNTGEQRLITFTLPRESCTVQDLLEQVGVPFDNTTTIQCVENPGANVDFVVTVGFSVQESPSELISRAEQTLQMSRQQDNSMAAVATQPAISTTTAANIIATPAAATAYSSLASATTTLGVEEPRKESSTLATNKTVSTTPANKAVEDVPRKIIQGFFAICQSCGFSGYDHAKCERCKRVFLEEPKRVPCVKSISGNSATGETLHIARMGMEITEKKRAVDVGGRGSKAGSSSYSASGSGSRGRGNPLSQRGRGNRSGRRAAEAEPVILTLSSDEEDEDVATKENSNNNGAGNSANTSTLMSITYKFFPFEPSMPEKDEKAIYADFKRGDVTDLSNSTDKLSTNVQCKWIRIGTHKFEPQESVIFTSRGIRIVAPLVNNQSDKCVLHIHKEEVVKVIAHFSTTTESVLCLYTLRLCAQYIRTSLNMKDAALPVDGFNFFAPNGPYQMRKIILKFDSLTEQAQNVIKSIWNFFDEISLNDAHDMLQRVEDADRKAMTNDEQKSTQLTPNEIRQLLIYPPGKGGISINTEDYMCLATDQYLNDIIIDFYLKWVHNNLIPEEQREKTFIFSTFFYKRLTTLTRHQNPDKDVKQTAAQKRHARVQNWTKNVNLFEKDFIIIPINEQSHWFLAIICFPKLKCPVTFDTNVPVELQQLKKQKGKKVALQIGNTTITPLSKRENVANVLAEVCPVADEDSERDEAEGDESDLASEDSDAENSTTTTTSVNNTTPNVTAVVPPVANIVVTTNPQTQQIKQPLILIFDSLAGASRSRVVATLRDYLTCEHRIKLSEATLHVFNKDNMPGHCVKVPQQNNFTDCGLYLLQYVEQFFKDPIRDYRLPIKQLNNWFDTLTVTKKREDISLLLQKLMNEKNGPNQKIILPEIPLPTLSGQLIEPPEGFNIEFEEEEVEEEPNEEEEDTTGNGDDMDAENVASTDETNVKSVTKATTTAALVPTQGRKIVIKRRMQIHENNEVAPAHVNITDRSLLKIRKVEQQ